MNELNTTNNKRFLLFSCAEYYPDGGMSDLFGTYDTAQEAFEAIESIKICNDYISIYDRLEGVEFSKYDFLKGKYPTDDFIEQFNIFSMYCTIENEEYNLIPKRLISRTEYNIFCQMLESIIKKDE